MSFHLWPLLAIVLSSTPALAVDPPSGLDPATFSREVLAHNPDLLAASSALDAARARARGAGTRPDPMASVGVAPLAFAPDAHRVGIEVALEQRLPISGRLKLERSAARAQVASAEADLDILRLDLALAAFELAEDRWLFERGVARADEQLRVVEEVAKATRAALASGSGRTPDALGAEATVETVRAEREGLLAARDATVARMNALLHRPPDAPLGPAEAAPLAVPAEVEADRAELVRAESDIEAARAMETMARRAWTPDLVAMTSYSTMWDAPEHRWMVGVAADLPVASRARRSGVDEAIASAHQLVRRHEAVADRVAAELYAARREAEASRAVAKAHQDRLLPLARDRLSAERAAFASGLASYVQVSEAVEDWLDAERAADEAASAARRAEARLLRAMGLPPGGVP